MPLFVQFQLFFPGFNRTSEWLHWGGKKIFLCLYYLGLWSRLVGFTGCRMYSHDLAGVLNQNNEYHVTWVNLIQSSCKNMSLFPSHIFLSENGIVVTPVLRPSSPFMVIYFYYCIVFVQQAFNQPVLFCSRKPDILQTKYQQTRWSYVNRFMRPFKGEIIHWGHKTPPFSLLPLWATLFMLTHHQITVGLGFVSSVDTYVKSLKTGLALEGVV